MSGPVFVSFEGGDGSGKTTQASMLSSAMIDAGYPTILVHDPGSTSFGNYIRQYIKNQDRLLCNEAELLVFGAARSQLVSEKIRPALGEGTNVIADRYTDSTLAYQGYGRGIDQEMIVLLNSIATHGLEPRVTFLMDVDPAKAHRQVGYQQLLLSLESHFQSYAKEDQEQRRFENMPLEFHRKVREGYLSLAKNDPERWVILDAMLLQEEIAANVWQRMYKLLEQV